MSSSPAHVKVNTTQAITFVSPVPYVFHHAAALNRNCSGAAASIAYSIVCPLLIRRTNVFAKRPLRAAARRGRLDRLPLALRGVLVQSIMLSGFS